MRRPDQTYTDEMKRAYWLLRAMSAEQRGFVLCWFCNACREYVGPGERHECKLDRPPTPEPEPK